MSKECVPLRECNNQKTRIVRYIQWEQEKKNYNKNQQKQQVKKKDVTCLRRERFILCYKMCFMEGKWRASVGESQNKCERESENDVKKKLNNEIDETKIEQQKHLQSSTDETKISLATSSKHSKNYGKQPTKVFNQAKRHTTSNEYNKTK